MKVGSLRRRSLQVTATSERHPYGAAAQRQTQNVHRSPKKVPRPPCHTCHRDEPNWLRASQQHEEAVRDNRRDGASAPSYPAAKGNLDTAPAPALVAPITDRVFSISGDTIKSRIEMMTLPFRPTCASRVQYCTCTPSHGDVGKMNSSSNGCCEVSGTQETYA